MPVNHYIPIDFNQPSICGLPKGIWKAAHKQLGVGKLFHVH